MIKKGKAEVYSMGADETQERPFVIEEWKEETLTDAVAIWNQVVEDGAAFIGVNNAV